MTGVRFDDLEALNEMISDEWGAWSKPHLITQDAIDTFGRVIDDMQWIHVDAARAEQESPLGTTIAHGFLVLSLLPSLRRSTDLLIVGHSSALNYGIDKLRFLKPVPVGSSIYCRTRLARAERRGMATTIDLAVATHLVDEEKPCLIFTWKLMYLK